ncbi:MAG: hypothetical protein WCS96_14790 [Victivallales bacterium]|jgi:rRNA-processing protein FCF1
MKGKIGTLVCDANILIDYFDNNKNVLKLATEHCYDIYVPVQVFEEVEQMGESDAEKLGIRLVEPTIAQLSEAVNDDNSLSDEDRLCFIIARDNKWICATNEKRLRNKCIRENVETIRGLKIMLELNALRKLGKQEAINTARKIKESNPRLAEEVVKDFNDALDRR